MARRGPTLARVGRELLTNQTETSQAVYSKCKGPEAEMGAASRTGEKAWEAGVVVVGRKEADSDGSCRIFL